MAVTVFTGGASGRTPQFGTFGNFAQPAAQTVYVTPTYLLKAAQRKYGQGIFVIGAVESELAEFWDTVEAKGANFDKNKRPDEVDRIIIDITAKEHCNYGSEKDTIEVETKQEEKKTQKKSYSLSFGKKSGWEFGGGLNVGASFFNTASASIGIQGKLTKDKWKSQEETKEEERTLGQTYGVTGEITVPPKTKVTVRITTYAVTYKVRVKVVFSVPATSYIRFYYKSYLGNLCCAGAGPTFRKLGYLTPQELFKNQNDFEDLTYCVQFTRDSDVSYIGETAEMTKKEDEL